MFMIAIAILAHSTEKHFCELANVHIIVRRANAPSGSLITFITGRNEVVAKVMFLLVSVILLTPQDGYCCGRYASYWNAFSFKDDFKNMPHL